MVNLPQSRTFLPRSRASSGYELMSKMPRTPAPFTIDDFLGKWAPVGFLKELAKNSGMPVGLGHAEVYDQGSVTVYEAVVRTKNVKLGTLNVHVPKATGLPKRMTYEGMFTIGNLSGIPVGSSVKLEFRILDYGSPFTIGDRADREEGIKFPVLPDWNNSVIDVGHLLRKPFKLKYSDFSLHGNYRYPETLK